MFFSTKFQVENFLSSSPVGEKKSKEIYSEITCINK